MGTLDMIRTYADRNPDGWVAARERGYRVEARRNHGHVDAVRNQPITLDNSTAVERVGAIRSNKLFVGERPRADRLVYVLLRQLTEIDPEAGRAGREWYDRNRERMTVDEGSDWINRIRAKIAAPHEVIPAPSMEASKTNAWTEWRRLAAELVATSTHPTGARFAVPTEDGARNQLAFWWISPGKGAHKGKFFLRQVIGGQGPVRVRMSPEAMVSLARKIMELGARDCMIRYGQEIGSCGHCGRPLTNDESRAAGIGPICRTR